MPRMLAQLVLPGRELCALCVSNVSDELSGEVGNAMMTLLARNVRKAALFKSS